jgi:hypothetical protein
MKTKTSFLALLSIALLYSCSTAVPNQKAKSSVSVHDNPFSVFQDPFSVFQDSPSRRQKDERRLRDLESRIATNEISDEERGHIEREIETLRNLLFVEP